jgi:hypothetical protein
MNRVKRLIAESAVVKETDLRSITRDSKRFVCHVTIDLGWTRSGHPWKLQWLTMGQAQIHSQRDNNDGRWRLEAHLKDNACDFEHDTAYAVRLPLIGLQLGPLAVHYSRTHLTAWVDPDAGDETGRHSEFHVPRPGYNPMEHPEASRCEGIYNETKEQWCKWNDGKPHVIVPEGFYVPPFDKELYDAVRGKRVEIVIGPAFEDDEQ